MRVKVGVAVALLAIGVTAGCSEHTVSHGGAPSAPVPTPGPTVVAPGQLPECSTDQVISCLHTHGPGRSYWVDSDGAVYPLEDM